MSVLEDGAGGDRTRAQAGPPVAGARRVPLSRGLSRRLVRAAGGRSRAGGELSGDAMRVDELIGTLGDRSFGWCIVLFALVNLMPIPFGGTMITSLPLILVTVQMALGLRELRLPGALMRREIGRKGFQKAVMRLRPLMRPIERVVRPRHAALFTARNEQLLGIVLVAVAVSLFLPIPLSGYLPAAALLVVGIGLVERDGLVALAGMILGMVAVGVTVAVGLAVVLGAQHLAG
jgi:hypothetical protein